VRGGGDGGGHVVLRVQLDDHTILQNRKARKITTGIYRP
jgi:hypothetical protein